MSDNFLMALSENEISQIEKIIGYTFKNKRLLSKAFTHNTYVNENKNAVSNERIEFLGDRVLNFIIAEKLYYNCSGKIKELNKAFSDKVQKTTLQKSIENLKLESFLKTGKSLEASGKNDSKFISDIYEALIAAIYIDSGDLGICANFVERTLADVLIVDYISLVKEWAEKSKFEINKEFFEENIAETKTFTIKMAVNGKIFEQSGKKKEEAEKEACKKACEFFKI